MSTQKINRRQFLSRALATGAGIIGASALVSCGPTSTPQVVEKEKVVTQVVEKQVTQAAPRFQGKLSVGIDKNLIPRERLETDRWDPPTYLNTLVADYKAQNPSVEIEILEWDLAQTPEGLAKLTTGMITGTAPDIIFNRRQVAEANSDKGWFVQLDPYLDMPNPYVEGNQQWRDIFVPEILHACKNSDGHWYVVPTSIIATCIFYNKDIFAKVGVQIPETWAEFMAISQKIKEAGTTPLAISMGPNFMWVDWAWRYLMDMVMDSKMSQIAELPPDKLGGMCAGKGFDTKQLCKAIKKGWYDATDKQFLEVPRLIKEWSQYWPEGFTQDLPNYEYFVEEKTSMLWDGTWSLKSMEYDDRRTFDWGIMRMTLPTLTKDSSPYATGIPAAFQAGQDTEFSICTSCRDRDLAADWLMFFSAPQNAGPLFSDLGTLAPAVVGAPVSDMMKPIVEFMKQPDIRLCPRVGLGSDGLDLECWQETYENLQAYVQDQISLEQFGDNVEKALLAAADRLSLANNWTF